MWPCIKSIIPIEGDGGENGDETEAWRGTWEKSAQGRSSAFLSFVPFFCSTSFPSTLSPIKTAPSEKIHHSSSLSCLSERVSSVYRRGEREKERESGGCKAGRTRSQGHSAAHTAEWSLLLLQASVHWGIDTPDARSASTRRREERKGGEKQMGGGRRETAKCSFTPRAPTVGTLLSYLYV